MDEVEPTKPFSLRVKLANRWRYRHITNPTKWRLRVQFDDLITAQYWDLARNFDELNERYSQYDDDAGPRNFDR